MAMKCKLILIFLLALSFYSLKLNKLSAEISSNSKASATNPLGLLNNSQIQANSDSYNDNLSDLKHDIGKMKASSNDSYSNYKDIKSLNNRKETDVYYTPDLNKSIYKATGVGEIKESPPNSSSSNKDKYENVQYVKELSEGGKKQLSLEESGDYEYLKVLKMGFEKPRMVDSVYENHPVGIDKIALLHSQSLAMPNESQVEFHKRPSDYETFHYQSAAKFNVINSN